MTSAVSAFPPRHARAALDVREDFVERQGLADLARRGLRAFERKERKTIAGGLHERGIDVEAREALTPILQGLSCGCLQREVTGACHEEVARAACRVYDPLRPWQAVS